MVYLGFTIMGFGFMFYFLSFEVGFLRIILLIVRREEERGRGEVGGW